MIVITGGAGFIGSVLLWKLNKEGFKDIIIVDQFDENSNWKNLNGKFYSEIFEKIEFKNLLRTGSFAKNCEMIFHMGACSATTEKNVS